MKQEFDYDNWSETVKSSNTELFGQGSEWVRDFWVTPWEVTLIEEMHLPRSVFKKSSRRCIIDYIITEDQFIYFKNHSELPFDSEDLYFDQQRYCEKGYGHLAIQHKDLKDCDVVRSAFDFLKRFLDEMERIK